MDQKNTIIKCAKHKCLFNNCGTCDQYVITIGVDNTCQAYTETEGFTFKEQKVCHPDCIHFDDSDPMVGPICLFQHPEPLKKFYEGMPCDYYHQKRYATENEEQIYNKTKEMLEKSGVTLINSTCGDCEYFADAGLIQCPCDKHEQYVYRKALACDDFKAKRGQRAKCNVYNDATFNLCSAACHNYDFKGASLYCQLRQEYLGPERLMKPCDLFVKAESDKFAAKMKIAELNKPNKNKTVIKKDLFDEQFDEEYEALFKSSKRPMSDHLCDIRCVSAHYAENGELYCALIQDFPERPLRCSAYDDGEKE